MRIPIAAVIFGAIFIAAAVSTIVAFVPTYVVGVEGVRDSVKVLRANTISRANNSIALFFKPTDTLIRGLQKLSDSGYLFDTRNESTVFPWLCEMQANLEPTSFKVSIISAPVDGLFPARYYNCESSVNGLVAYGYDNDFPGNASLVPPYWTRISRPITLWNRATNSRGAPVSTHAGAEQRTLLGLMGQINDNRNRTWTKVLAGGYGTEMGAAAHFRDTNGNYGRIHAELLPSNLAVLLSNLGLQKNGRAVAVEVETRRVMGVSWAGELMLVPSPQFDNKSLPDHLRFSFKSVTNLTDTTTTDAVAELGGEDVFYSLPDGYKTTLYSGKKTMFVDIATYTDATVNLDIRVLVLMSEHDFLEEIQKQQDATIGGIVAAVAIMLVVGVAFGISMARPLQRLGTRMDATARLQDEEEDDPQSVIGEIAEMQQAYVAMKGELTRIKSYLPQSVLQGLKAGANDDPDDDDEGSIASTGTGSRSRSVSKTNGTNKPPSQDSSLDSKGMAAAAAGALNVRTGVVHKRATVISFNLVGFLKRVQRDISASSAGFGQCQKTLLDVVESHAVSNRGVIDSFQGDHVVVTFNAVTNCANAGRRAAHCAQSVAQECSKRSEMPPVTAGIASSLSECGNMGSNSMKRFNIIGPCFVDALMMERAARHRYVESVQQSKNAANRPWCIMMTSDLFVEVGLDFYYESVDVVQCVSTNKAVAVLQGPKSAAEDEWMYQLKEGEDGDPFVLGNEAFAAVAGSKPEAAEAVGKVAPGPQQERLNQLLGEGVAKVASVISMVGPREPRPEK